MPFRPLFILAALLSPVAAQLHTFAAPNEITGSTNLSQLIYLDWNGDPTRVIGIDPLKKQLVAAPASYAWSFSSPTVLRQNLPANSRVLKARIDGDALDDLVLLADNRAYVWTSGFADPSLSREPDLQFTLPAAINSFASPAAIADFDGDGFDDLLLPQSSEKIGQGYPIGSTPTTAIIFSFGKPDAVVQTLPELPPMAVVRAGPPLAPGATSSIVITGAFPSDKSTQVLQVASDRSISLAESFDQSGLLIDLDGNGTAEFAGIELTSVDFETTARVQIRQRQGGAWSLVASFPAYPLDLMKKALVADFNQDGRQEMILARDADLYSGLPAGLMVLKSNGDPAAATLTDTLSAASHVLSVEAVPYSLSQTRLVVCSTLSRVTDLLGFSEDHPQLGTFLSLWQDPIGAPGDAIVLNSRKFFSDIEWMNLNGDATPDLALEDRGSLQGLAGPLPLSGPATSLPLSPLDSAESFLAADIDRDGDDDLLVSTLNEIKALRSDDGLLSASTSSMDLGSGFVKPGEPPQRVLGAADFDGDGDLDTLYLDSYLQMICWAENTGTGNFGTRHPIALAGSSYIYDIEGRVPFDAGYRSEMLAKDQVIILDADQDGDPDILTYGAGLGDRVTLHRNTPAGFTAEPVTTDLFGPFSAQPSEALPHGLPRLNAGHFKASADPAQFSIFAPASGALGYVHSLLWIVTGGPAGFTVSAPLELPYAGTIAVLDFDQDGIDDFVTAGSVYQDLLGNPIRDTELRLYRNRGDGTVETPVVIGKTLGYTTRLLAKDIDGDGLADIIAASRYTGTVEVFHHGLASGYPTFAEWKAAYGIATSGANDDDDLDGKPNLLEYVDGTPPVAADHPSPSLPAVVGASSVEILENLENSLTGEIIQARLSHPRPKPVNGQAPAIVVETSPDMATWSPSTATPTIHTDPAHPQWETLYWEVPVEYTDASQSQLIPKRFFRFRVTQ